MTHLRSLMFLIAAGVWTIVLAILYLPLLALPRSVMQRAGAFWCRGVLALLAAICDLRYRVQGREHLPAGAVIIAAKHQSAWDTLVFHCLVCDPVYVLKRELISVPGLGWYLKKAGNIPIDRAAGAVALKRMLDVIARRLDEGAQVIIFPEGTRVAPGTRRRYNPGVFALDQQTSAPVVPVALNSGRFWGRRSLWKHPGVITLRFLPPLPKGLDRSHFMALLEARIEEACAALDALEPGDGRAGLTACKSPTALPDTRPSQPVENS